MTFNSQILAEKEKEAENFYKSSDSEDDTHEATSFTCENEKKSVANEEESIMDNKLVYARDTQNNETDNQNFDSREEIIQQCNIDLAAHEIPLEDDSCAADNENNSHVLGLPLPKFADDNLIDKKRLLPNLANLASNSEVTLKGSPGMIIDLTDSVKPSSKGVNRLLDRFFCKHVVNTNKRADNTSEVTITHLQDTQDSPVPAVKEVLPYKLPTDTDNSELNKPGAKLMRLKEHLKLQMSRKRNEEWKQKKTELQAQKKDIWEEEEEADYDLDKEQRKTDILDSSDSGESEPEENDVCIKDKKKKKCLFADDEAEVTDNEDSDVEEADTDEVRHNRQSTNFKHGGEKGCINDNGSEEMEEVEEEDEENNDENDEGTDEDDEDEDESELENEAEFTGKNNIDENINIVGNEKRRKRLIQKYQDDDSENEDSRLKSIADAHTFEVHSEDNSLTSENDSNTQHQPEVITKSQICKTPIAKTSMLDFVSPVTQLSALNTSFDSNKKEHPATQSDQSFRHDRGITSKAYSQKVVLRHRRKYRR